MTKLEVCPGICGLTAIITADLNDDEELELAIDTPCAGCRKMVEEIMADDELEPFDLVFNKPGEGPVYAAARHCPHGACVVPAALIKCVEAECRLALPKDVTFRFLP